jgi:hypothetical protein
MAMDLHWGMSLQAIEVLWGSWLNGEDPEFVPLRRSYYLYILLSEL